MDSTTIKLASIVVIGGACLIASVLVLGLGAERAGRQEEARAEVRSTWGMPQTVLGPVLVFRHPASVPNGPSETIYVLPKTLHIESVLTPEVRTRGIFDTAVYTETIKLSGTFGTEELRASGFSEGVLEPVLSVGISDTRSIEQQVTLTWNASELPFDPGAQTRLMEESGIHVNVPFDTLLDEHTFAFELTLKGSERAMVAPVGKETDVHMTSSWATPAFLGAFLPSQRNVTPEGFDATWRVSSFGRNYPQYWLEDGSVTFSTLISSTFGVGLHEGVDLYSQVSRSVKYAILFIVLTFAAFFLFEILLKVRIHPVQYLLIGCALALFYLLLLSFAEHIGFLAAYLIATTMIVGLITGYSASVLKARRFAMLVCGILVTLYGYLYFVLQLEDQALLFGALLLFALLAVTMYVTRNIDWFASASSNRAKDSGAA